MANENPLPVADSDFGVRDNSYQAAGEIAGLLKLASDFYDQMEQRPEAAVIRQMHPRDLSESKQKLAYFLAGWLGGPKLYNEHYGPISIPDFHKHLTVDEAERDAWLSCMAHAIQSQDYTESFQSYLLTQLRFPAERIRQVSKANRERKAAKAASTEFS